MSNYASRWQEQVELLALQSLRKLNADHEQKHAFANFLEKRSEKEIAVDDLEKSAHGWASLWKCAYVDPRLLSALQQRISENEEQVKNCEVVSQDAEKTLEKAKAHYTQHCEIESEYMSRSREYVRKIRLARDDKLVEFLSLFRAVQK